MLLQDAIERFLERKWRISNQEGNSAEQCMQALGHYLLYFSDLYHDQDDTEFNFNDEKEDAAEWEQELEEVFREKMDDEETPSWSLGGLDSTNLEASHLREFIGWYLPRMSCENEMMQDFCREVEDLCKDFHQQNVIDQHLYQDFISTIMEMKPEAMRVIKASQLLLHFVRWGSNLSRQDQALPISQFVEGHARLKRIQGQKLWWSFDDEEKQIGPVIVDQFIVDLLYAGDVLNVQLAQRGEQWQMVDIGPLYPRSIYVEAESYDDEEDEAINPMN
ncbi:MAG: hypothetical protein Q9M28_09130 [Mariprofundaceae bacterium]|nr:hypothetical protein [Mariprofundaceae bacterium]